MKNENKILIMLLFFTFLLGNATFSQTFFVKGDAQIIQPIINRMMELNQKLTTKIENSDYTLDCTNIVNVRVGVAKGFISIVDSKTGDIIAKTDEIKATVGSYFKDAKPKVAEKIAKKALSELLLKIKK